MIISIIIKSINTFSLLYQMLISKLANYFNDEWNTNYHTNNTSNGVATPHAIYFIATAFALFIFVPTQKQVLRYLNNQLAGI